MSNKTLNLGPFQNMLAKEVDAEYLAERFTELLIAHMRVSLFVVAKDMDNHVYVHENNDDHIYFLQRLIDVLRETAEINKQPKN